jgi:hypothetical protein
MAISYSWIGFLKKCWEFLVYVVNFFRGKKQNEVNKINEDLQHQYNKIDQDKEDNKQHDTEDRINNIFK